MKRPPPTERGADPVGHFIDGHEVESSSGEHFATVSPSTGDEISRVALGGPDDVHRAAEAASASFRDGSWSKASPDDRAGALRCVAALIRERADELARLESADTGKPLSQARAEVLGAADSFTYYAGHAELPVGEVFPAANGRLMYSTRRPYGVIAAICPWNYPFHIACQKVAPNLAVGNSIVLKAAEQTPLTGAALARIVLDGGVPPGVLNVVHGLGDPVGSALVQHPEVCKVTFTGSTQTGRSILRASADRITSVHLELGGKSPNIVFDDADVEQAVAGSLFTSFNNCGQICTSGSRLIVQRGVAADVVDALVERARAIVVGPPDDPETMIGPLISEAHRAKVLGYVDGALREGARLALGGSPLPGDGFYMAPTVFVDVHHAMTIANDEIFGPVVSVLVVDDEAEAVALANDVMYGLAASVWTTDLGRAFRMAEQIDAGIVWTNCTQDLPTRVPYEGHKASGLGVDQGVEALREFTQLQTHVVNFSGERVRWA